MTPLRDYQAQAVNDLRASLAAGKRRPVLQAPTGYGKTRLAAEVVNLALAKRKRITFCVPALSLIDQTVQMFWDEGITDVGVIQAQHTMTDWSKPVQIASVQTLGRRGYPQCDIVLIDECHRFFEIYEKWLHDPDWQTVPFIGLSATPWTNGLGRHFDDLIISATTSDLIAQGYLSKFRVFGPKPFDVSGVKVRAGDYVESELAKAVNTTELVGDVVETWIRLGEDRPTFCFAVDRAHAKALEIQFIASGVVAAYQDAETTPSERADIKRRFHNGEIKVVCSVGTLTTGVDWDVRCIVMARPTKSKILFVQIIGRGLRTAEGKADCLILDHTTTHDELGYVTDIGQAHLDDGNIRHVEKKTTLKLPRRCPKCSYMKPAGIHACPECGFAPVEQIKPRAIDHIAGELEELTKQGGTCKVSDRVIQMRGRQFPLSVFFGALLTYSNEKGYKPGWAFHKYIEATGARPNTRNVAPCMIPDEVQSWIHSRQIAWAKSKRRKQQQAPDARETAG